MNAALHSRNTFLLALLARTCGLLLLIAFIAAVALLSQAPSRSLSNPLQFSYQPIPFHLESDETTIRHVPAAMAGGVAVFDYNNDGRPDIFFTNGANLATLKKDDPKYSNRLFRNDGNGKFTDVTREAGLEGTGYDIGVAVGDYDNDGHPDLFVAGVHHCALYHNNGDGTFTDVTVKSGLDAVLDHPDPQYGPLWAIAAAWVDVNNDGKLDLFVANYLLWDYAHEPRCDSRGVSYYCHPKAFKPSPNQLLLNNGDGSFTDISAQSGIRASLGKAMSVGVADYDMDGKPDIFVTNDAYYNSLFHNLGNNKFEEVAFPAGVALPDMGAFVSGMGLDFRDYNNDGLPDIVFSALNNQSFPIFQNTGKDNFVETTTQLGIEKVSRPMSGYGVGLVDFDNDGWKDLFIARGHVDALPLNGELVEQHNTIFRNPGASGGQFVPLTEEAGFSARPPARHRGSAFADLDGDGRVDVVVSAIGADAEIWMNRSTGNNHWLEVSLEGTRSNRDGIGAVVKVVSNSGTQYNHMTSSVSYASSSLGPVHFGLGNDASANLIEIHWPSGTIQRLTNVPANQVLKVKEPSR